MNTKGYPISNVLKNPIAFIRIVILFSFIIISACEREQPITWTVDCSSCYQIKPEWAKLDINVTINQENPYVALAVYIGNIEDNNLDWLDTTYSSNYWVDVKPDRYYSVKAQYRKGTKTVFAVDGDKVNFDLIKSECDRDCYYQRGGNIDVRLMN